MPSSKPRDEACRNDALLSWSERCVPNSAERDVCGANFFAFFCQTVDNKRLLGI